jgi:hypothetical protein
VLGLGEVEVHLPGGGRELAIVGIGVDCGGAVDSLLAGLAGRLGRLDIAAERAQAGLALETGVGSAVWIARTEDLIDRIRAAEAAAHRAGDRPDARGVAGYLRATAIRRGHPSAIIMRSEPGRWLASSRVRRPGRVIRPFVR